MKLTDYLVRFLHKQGVTHIFELSGGMIAHIIDSLYEFGQIQVVTMHHEQGAAFAADGFARVKGVPGVALATSGPGATNLITGMGSCFFDSVPAIFITGQVNQHERRKDKSIRQLGFQEMDIIDMVGPVCKGVFSIESPDELPLVLERAFELAMSGRPGPVLIDIPMNLQRADIDAEIPLVKPVYNNVTNLDADFWDGLHASIIAAKKPLILAGRGILSSYSRPEFKKLVELTKIPVITSLMAVDAIPFDNPLRVGFIGAYGNRWANMSISDCDFMLVIGSRLDIRQTGAFVESFGNKKIYHIDIEPGEINNRIKGCVPVVSDLKTFLGKAIKELSGRAFPGYTDWYDQINALREQWPDIKESGDIAGINPNVFMHTLSKGSKESGAYLADVGNHQMWAAQSLELVDDQYFITSGGMGAMGFALPAAIGTCIGLNKPVVMVAGDGGFQLNIQELQTIVRNKLPVKMVVINNKSLGMIRQFQDSYFKGKHQSTIWGYDTPDFEKVAMAYGIRSATITKADEVAEGVRKLWETPDEPYLLQVILDSTINAYPKLAFGKPITEMEPFAKPLEMEGT